MSQAGSDRAPPLRPDDRLEVAAVARRLGVAPATLRSWHRRYGIGPSAYSSGDRRAYTAADVARLEVMQDAMLRGASAAEAARTALATVEPLRGPSPAGPAERVVEPAVDTAGSGRQGGRGLRLPSGGPRARGLGRAALALDPTAVDAVLTEAVADLGVARTWDELARPVLVAVAERWERTATGVEVEHLLSECLGRVFHRVVDHTPAPRNARPVLLAAVPGEAHSLPLGALAAVLAERAVSSRLLGAALPEDAVRAAVRRTGPVAAFLWAHAGGPHLVDLLADPPRSRPPGRWFVGGPGWAGQELPPDVPWCTSLGEAADLVERVVVPRTGAI